MAKQPKSTPIPAPEAPAAGASVPGLVDAPSGLPPEEVEAEIAGLAELLDVPRDEVFGVSLARQTIVTRDGRKLTVTA